MANPEQLQLLQGSVEEWNQWREENPYVAIDLREAELGYIDLFEANLNEADLRKANLRETDLRLANLSLADLSGAYLSRVKLNLADLREAKLIKTNLMRANFFEADLSEANLTDANLGECEAIAANFTYATLTGACILDWKINAETKFEGVICDYVYSGFNWSTEQYGERRPQDGNQTFKPGEFQGLVDIAKKPIDLIFSDGIDWKAFLESFNGLQVENSHSKLSIKAIEKKDDGKFILRVNAPLSADKAALEKSFYQKYRRALTAVKQQYQQLLEAQEQKIEEKDEDVIKFMLKENSDLKNIIDILANQPLTLDVKALSQKNMWQTITLVVGANEWGI